MVEAANGPAIGVGVLAGCGAEVNVAGVGQYLDGVLCVVGVEVTKQEDLVGARRCGRRVGKLNQRLCLPDTVCVPAALAGVDVRLMLPMRADNRLTHLGSCSYLADVLYAGVKVYFYKKGVLHSKLMVSDDELSTVGSTNVDFRSFEHNFEVNAFIYDTETALQMREIFLQDQHDCVQVFLKNWVKRPWYHKAAESIVRLMAPLL